MTIRNLTPEQADFLLFTNGIKAPLMFLKHVVGFAERDGADGCQNALVEMLKAYRLIHPDDVAYYRVRLSEVAEGECIFTSGPEKCYPNAYDAGFGIVGDFLSNLNALPCFFSDRWNPLLVDGFIENPVSQPEIWEEVRDAILEYPECYFDRLNRDIIREHGKVHSLIGDNDTFVDSEDLENTLRETQAFLRDELRNRKPPLDAIAALDGSQEYRVITTFGEDVTIIPNGHLISFHQTLDSTIGLHRVLMHCEENGWIRECKVQLQWKEDPLDWEEQPPDESWCEVLPAVMDELKMNDLRSTVPSGKQSRKKGTVNQRMLQEMQGNADAMGWSCTVWAKHLKCVKSTVSETKTFKTMESHREKEKASRTTNRRRNRRPMS